MKRILLLTLVVLFAAPCFAHKTYFAELPLFSIPSEKGKVAYQLVLSDDKRHEGKSALSLTVEEIAEEDFDLVFWSDLNERNEEGTYHQVRELNYNTPRHGATKDAYVTRTYYLVDENNSLNTAIFQIKRVIQLENMLRIYTFTFEQELNGADVKFLDPYGNKKALPPADYFNYIVQSLAKRWTYEINHLILPLFNK